MSKIPPVIVLFFLSPIIAELLSGSAPPAEFFQPFGFVIITTLYGSGAILAREFTIRWQKGWLSLFLLGAAYGIIEEGLMVKSFFDPGWIDLGILGTYGRSLGINWVWAVELTVYHAVFSIMIPILLTELIFSDRKGKTWVGKRTLGVFLFLLAANTAFGYFFLTDFRPAATLYALTFAIVAALIIVAWRIPSKLLLVKAITVRRSLWFWLTGFLGTAFFFAIFWGLPNTALPPFLTILLGVGLVCGVTWLVLKMSDSGRAWNEMQRLALAAGLLTPLILLTPVHEFDVARTDNTTGMIFVGLGMLCFLLWLRWRLKRLPGRSP